MSPAMLDITLSLVSLLLGISYLAAIPVIILRLPVAQYLRVAFAATLVLWSISYAISGFAGISGELGLTEEQPDLYWSAVVSTGFRVVQFAIVWVAMVMFVLYGGERR